VGVVLGRILGEAARCGALPVAAGGERDPELVSDGTAAILGGEHPALDDAVRLRALLAWSSVLGTISFELFGHLVGSVTDTDRYFGVAMGELADLVGL
jgi:hypothetical protein